MGHPGLVVLPSMERRSSGCVVKAATAPCGFAQGNDRKEGKSTLVLFAEAREPDAKFLLSDRSQRSSDLCRDSKEEARN
jgi:hypothetical protein